MAKKEVVMVALIAMVAIEHDGETVVPGEAFELDEKQAQPLIDVGAARLQEPDEVSDADAASGDGSAGGDGTGAGAGEGVSGNAGNGDTNAKTPAAKTPAKKR